MGKITKVYIDSRYKTTDSVSNNDFKFELKEALDLPDNTVCYVDDISIPPTWHTIEQINSRLYIIIQVQSPPDPDWLHPLVLELPPGNYTGSSSATTLNELLQDAVPDHGFVCTYHVSRRNVTIESTTIHLSQVLTDFQVITNMANNYLFFVWKDNLGSDVSVDVNILISIKSVLRNTGMGHYDPQNWQNCVGEIHVTTYDNEFLDLLHIHNIYLHSPNPGHFNSFGIR